MQRILRFLAGFLALLLARPFTADAFPLEPSPAGLHGCATGDGLWVNLASGHAVSVKAVAWGRGELAPLAEQGAVHRGEGITFYERAGVTEEYSVSPAGVRQDFVVARRPDGVGELRVDLLVRGAEASGSGDGIRLRVPDGATKLDYGALLVTDADQRVLPARLEAVEPGRLQVRVKDDGARYPVRIDPTFSNARWSGRGGEPGIHYASTGLVPDLTGGFDIYGDYMRSAGTNRVNGIAHWSGSGWQTKPAPTTGNFIANAGVRYSGDLVLATAARVHRWTGTAWESLGTANSDAGGGSALGLIKGLAVHEGKLVVCGQFSGIEGVAARNVAVWDGQAWAPLGSGVSGGTSLANVAVSVSTNLYVGGLFTLAGGVNTTNMARWDGHQWHAVGAGPNGAVLALEHWNGHLFAGGSFTQAGTVSARNMARWDGSTWHAMAGGVNQMVYSLRAFGTNLVAAGQFDTADGLPASGVAAWDGSAWSTLGSGLESDYMVRVTDLDVVGGDLVAAGTFVLAGGKVAANVARWDGTNWHAYGEGLGGTVPPILLAAAWFNGEFYAGGYFFLTQGGSNSMHIAKWAGNGWVGVGGSVNGRVRALVEHDGALVAGGDFTMAGGVPAARVARWDGSAWSAVGGGVSNTVNCLLSHQGQLVAGGTFLQAGGVSASRIAVWNGSTWQPLGAGVNGAVRALASHGGDIVAGGAFTSAGLQPASRIARWAGSAWSPLGAGMNADVTALTPFDGGLVAGGLFTQAGGLGRSRIAFWNGSSWQDMGGGLNDSALCLAASGGWLYAGGGFTMAGGVPAGKCAAWNGSAWVGLGSGLSGLFSDLRAEAMVVRDNRLDVVGHFQTAGDVAVNMAATFDITPAPPQVSALTVTNLAFNAARLAGWVNPNGVPTTARIEYGPGTNFTTTVTLTLSPANGTSPQAFSVPLTGLVPETAYLARLIAGNADGTASSAPISFTTPPHPGAAGLLAAWRVLHFQSPDNAGDGADGADPDGDGTVNLLEWACGSNPTISTPAAFAPDEPPSLERCRYTRSVEAVTAGVEFVVEVTDVLPATAWTALPQVIVSDNGTVQVVTATLPAGPATRYVRLKVTLPP